MSAALDEIDPIPGRYTLSVSSPGLERRLRTPAHFARAVGETVTVRVNAGTADVRRLTGTLDGGRRRRGSRWRVRKCPTGEIRIAYDDDRAGADGVRVGARRSRAKSEPKSRRREGEAAMSKTNFEFLDALGQIAA